MTASPIQFKRMVLSLPHGRLDRRSFMITARLAQELRLNLVAAYAEESSLVDVAALPCVREWRSLGGGWQRIEISQIARELDSAAALARRMFEETVRQLQVPASFTSAKGSIADVIKSIAGAQDIIGIIEPPSPAERISHQFTQLIDAAFKTAAAVLIVPSRIVSRSGPAIAIAADPLDPAIAVARTIAAESRKSPLVVGFDDPAAGGSAAWEQLVDLSLRLVPGAPSTVSAWDLAMTLAPLEESLIVATRGVLDDRSSAQLASLRGTPVLVIEPPLQS